MKEFTYRLVFLVGLILFLYSFIGYFTTAPDNRENYLSGREFHVIAPWIGAWVLFVLYISVFAFYHFLVNKPRPSLYWLPILLFPAIGSYIYLERFIVPAGLLTNPAWRFRPRQHMADDEIARTSIRRLAAALCDYMLFLNLSVFFTIMYGTRSYLGTIVLADRNALPLVVAWFCYFPLAEFLFGCTLGKLCLGLRVVHGDGSKVSMAGAIRRHSIDLIDFIFFLLICFVRVREGGELPRRLGDYWGHTWVVLNNTKRRLNVNE